MKSILSKCDNNVNFIDRQKLHNLSVTKFESE